MMTNSMLPIPSTIPLRSTMILRTLKIRIANFQKQLLKGVITDTKLPLGSTPNGQAWCTKALHPSDQELPTGGLPFPNSLPSAVLHFNSKFKVAPPPGMIAGQTWGCDILTRPDPCNFGAAYKAITGFIEPLVSRATQPPEYFLNNQVGTTDPNPNAAYAAKRQFWESNVSLYRINYAGVTLTADGPDLSNAGMITATQFPIVEKTYSASIQDDRPGLVPAYAMTPMATVISTDDFPTFDMLQNLPGVYSGKAKEGCYVPHHLSHQDFEWKAPANSTLYHGTFDEVRGTDTNVSHAMINIGGPSQANHPIHPVVDLCAIKGGVDPPDLTMQHLLPPATWNMSQMSLRGLASTTTIYVQYRVAFELVCKPGSIYSPYVQKPPFSDPSAVEAYFAIVRLLADAYPESYNSLGTILGTIASVASEVMPHVLPLLKQGWNSLKSCWTNGKDPDTRATEKVKRIAQASAPRVDNTAQEVAKAVLRAVKSQSGSSTSSKRKGRKSKKGGKN